VGEQKKERKMAKREKNEMLGVGGDG